MPRGKITVELNGVEAEELMVLEALDWNVSKLSNFTEKQSTQ